MQNIVSFVVQHCHMFHQFHFSLIFLFARLPPLLVFSMEICNPEQKNTDTFPTVPKKEGVSADFGALSLAHK